MLGSWTISTSGASSPTGITLDPSNPQHLWIVDNGTDRVYQYDYAVSRTSGSQAASTNFALAAGNTNPQGIADPPASGMMLTPAPLPEDVTNPRFQPIRTEALAAGNAIYLDDNAAGWGWFVDPTPWGDSEFTSPGNQGEQNRMDLLTVIEHEIGHLLGRDHDEEGVMAETLAAGTRPGATRGPDADLWLMEAALFGAVDVDVERPWLGNRGRVMH